MARFIMFYHMGNSPPASPEAGAEMMQKWQDWIAQNAAALVEPENPYGLRKIVSKDGIQDAPISPTMGYGIIEAADFDAALALAHTSPFLDMGTLEIIEVKSR